jgi:FkbM family methyltransferase
VGFEPHPEAFQVAQRNFQRNKFRDVTLHECALDEKPGVVQLSYIPGEIMASTTTNRLCVRGQIPLTVSVKTAQLSPFLEEDVDFLKLDIEGAEQRVLKEAGNKLRRIKYMFIEFHQTRGDKSNSLPVSVELLENNGFDYLITSTLSTRTTAAVAPLPECGPVCSFYIFAKRVD